MVSLRQGLLAEGVRVSMAQLCRWFEQPRRTVYYKPVKSPPKIRPELAGPIKAMIEAEPSFGYRTVASLLGMNKNTVQRVFQQMGWQVRKPAVGHRPRVQALPSVAGQANERWATDLCRVWAGRDGWLSLALVIDCHTRELLGWQLSRSGKATTAASALEQALIARFGSLAPAPRPFLLRSDNGLVFTAALSATERDGRTCDPDAEGAVHQPTSFREPAPRQPRDLGLDPVLQPPAPASGAGHEDTR